VLALKDVNMKMLFTFLIMSAILAGGAQTPAGRAIEVAQQAIAKEPANADHHNQLALALTRRARETADTAYYERAAIALSKSLELKPGNLEALKLKAWTLLGMHQFAEALALAKELRGRTGDDEMVYGLLTDANVELGNYKEAEDAAQWMLNVGRGSIPGLTRAAYLRELFGDIEGALELLNQVLHRLDPAETEDRAWTLTQIAHVLSLTGRLEEAASLLKNALGLVPDYHYALAGLAKVRTTEGRHAEAVDLLRRRYQRAPHPENLFDLGVALYKAGELAESEATLANFEQQALAESESWDNANRELVMYYADYANQPAAALRIARREVARRNDVQTLDVYAWALHRNGKHAAAVSTIEMALAVGAVDPHILHRAGVIESAAGNASAARKYLERSLEVNSRSEIASEASRLLGQLNASASR
jgi:tetratricopeptide (TPR) repeat protein